MERHHRLASGRLAARLDALADLPVRGGDIRGVALENELPALAAVDDLLDQRVLLTNGDGIGGRPEELLDVVGLRDGGSVLDHDEHVPVAARVRLVPHHDTSVEDSPPTRTEGHEANHVASLDRDLEPQISALL